MGQDDEQRCPAELDGTPAGQATQCRGGPLATDQDEGASSGTYCG
jgi:hypothetical protein